MQHTIQEMLDKIKVMQQKAELLEKEHMNKTPDEVQYLSLIHISEPTRPY